jgi:hypothetical protein
VAVSMPSISGGRAYTESPAGRTPGQEAVRDLTPRGGSTAGTDTYVPSGSASPSFVPAYGPRAYTSPPASNPAGERGTAEAPPPAVGAPPSAEDSNAAGKGECTTCAERTYQDGSSDPGVSFKSATHVSPEAAAIAVSSHESEHVGREQLKAKAEHKSVVSQVVRIHTSVCTECGRVYVSGGTTTTVTKSAPQETRGQGMNISV